MDILSPLNLFPPFGGRIGRSIAALAPTAPALTCRIWTSPPIPSEDVAPSNQLFIGCDNLLTIDSLTLQSSGEVVDDATVAAVLRDADGNQIAAVDLAFAGDADSGRYQGLLPAATPLAAGAHYFLEFTETVVGVATGFQRKRFTADYYQGEP